MGIQSRRSLEGRLLLAGCILAGMLLACARSVQPVDDPAWRVPGGETGVPVLADASTSTPFLPATRLPGAPILTPTPDEPHPMPEIRREPLQYVVQAGDSLGTIAQRYGVTLEQLITTNEIKNANLLEVGQELTVPVPTPLGMGPDFKIIPDSELVFGPAAASFDMNAFVNSQGGYLAQYKEEVDGKTLTGIEIVDRVARDFSVNPRLLLAVLQYQSGWLSKTDLPEGKIDYPMGVREEWRKGLYRQLAWAANNLNRGYYLWRVNGISTWLLGDGSVVPIAATINAGTAGVQSMFAALYASPGVGADRLTRGFLRRL